jgi:hypothetical protein
MDMSALWQGVFFMEQTSGLQRVSAAMPVNARISGTSLLSGAKPVDSCAIGCGGG